ncbi:MAG: hypothetical protein HY517_03140 [Candidatus Aenigmarchaeota archaeon]|nr:hypothetical protein [Candidatus Aenigmarchaeota archaeon]
MTFEITPEIGYEFADLGRDERRVCDSYTMGNHRQRAAAGFAGNPAGLHIYQTPESAGRMALLENHIPGCESCSNVQRSLYSELKVRVVDQSLRWIDEYESDSADPAYRLSKLLAQVTEAVRNIFRRKSRFGLGLNMTEDAA